jgi:hypothetical protein
MAIHSGKCVAVQGGASGAGVNLVQAPCEDVPSQKFQIK